MPLTPDDVLGADLSGGLSPDKELVFAAQPDDPDMRESMSLWLYDDRGRFAFPRMGIEAEASSWDNRRVQGNFSFPGGRILNGAGIGAAHSPIAADGRPTILGAGPIRFEMLEPFRRWRVVFDGSVIDGTSEQQIAKTLDPARRTDVRLDVELEMVVPAWVQDLSPEAVAKLSPEAQVEAANMGIGWRLEQLFRARGTYTVDGQTHDFTGTGSRIKRQSVRPLAGFRGHTWQSAVFPNGDGFGSLAYPPRDDGSEGHNDAYVYKDGRFYPAKLVRVPWLRRIVSEGDDVSLALESDLGITEIGGVTSPSTFRVGNPDIGGLNLQQGGAVYTWGDQSAYGMIERSAHESLTAIG
ncbi:hypothetical protein LWE61_02645 [Sphingobium sufflavum]|uniref:hypothetical protein n=1 Tax=Sphingobium sufflavum TaxID=1129547 RepID=UPI001F446E49|nr:hypothetical protein [Sphingobium sufflavum]MCE7795451.1 hypothetical protein [Sphingobium sufflavum]